jgi:hypothetical protein
MIINFFFWSLNFKVGFYLKILTFPRLSETATIFSSSETEQELKQSWLKTSTVIKTEIE